MLARRAIHVLCCLTTEGMLPLLRFSSLLWTVPESGTPLLDVPESLDLGQPESVEFREDVDSWQSFPFLWLPPREVPMFPSPGLVCFEVISLAFWLLWLRFVVRSMVAGVAVELYVLVVLLGVWVLPKSRLTRCFRPRSQRAKTKKVNLPALARGNGQFWLINEMRQDKRADGLTVYRWRVINPKYKTRRVNFLQKSKVRWDLNEL